MLYEKDNYLSIQIDKNETLKVLFGIISSCVFAVLKPNFLINGYLEKSQVVLREWEVSSSLLPRLGK